MIWGAIAGAVVGGLINKKAAKDQREAAVNDARLALPRLRASAEEAGFNPLTALANGALGSFQNIPSGAAPLASQSIIDRVVTGIEDRVTGKEAERDAHERAGHELMQIQLERAKAGGGYPIIRDTALAGATSQSGGFSTPPFFGGRQKAQPSEITKPQPTPTQGETIVTNPFPLSSGNDMFVDPRNVDAEHGEQRYGDIAQEIMGAGNVIADFQYNKQINNIRRRFGDGAARQFHSDLVANPKMDVDEYLKDLEIGKMRRDPPTHEQPADTGQGSLERADPDGFRLERKRNDFLRRTAPGGTFYIP